MTFGTVSAPQARALWELAAAMTRWEPLSAQAALDRVRKAGDQVGLPLPACSDLPADPGAFVHALSTLRGASLSTRRLALRGALETALGSGTLPLAQNLALRTVTEALNLEPAELETLFSDRTGARLPPPWDPSLRGAWLNRDASGGTPGSPWDDSPPAAVGPAPEEDGRIQRIKAMALLGLDEGASLAEIKRAFLRISQVHHPDHYAALGMEATQEADRSFRRIKEAYEFLMKAEP